MFFYILVNGDYLQILTRFQVHESRFNFTKQIVWYRWIECNTE